VRHMDPRHARDNIDDESRTKENVLMYLSFPETSSNMSFPN